MKYRKGKEISTYSREDLKSEIDLLYGLAEDRKKQEIAKLSSAYQKIGCWDSFNKLCALAATNIEDYIRSDTQGYQKLRALQQRYKDLE